MTQGAPPSRCSTHPLQTTRHLRPRSRGVRRREVRSPPPTGDQDQDLPTNFWAVRVRRHRPGLACTLPKASPELLVGRYLAQLGRADWWNGCWWSQLPLGPLREFRQGSPYKNLRELREQTYSCVPELKITAAFLRRRRRHLYALFSGLHQDRDLSAAPPHDRVVCMVLRLLRHRGFSCFGSYTTLCDLASLFGLFWASP